MDDNISWPYINILIDEIGFHEVLHELYLSPVHFLARALFVTVPSFFYAM